jgi:hypothetical protein
VPLKVQLKARQNAELVLADHREILLELGINLKFFFWYLERGFTLTESTWLKCDWDSGIPIKNLDDDDFLIIKQDGVLTPFDSTAETPFVMDS